MEKNLYKEEQRFSQWMSVVLFVVFGLPVMFLGNELALKINTSEYLPLSIVLSFLLILWGSGVYFWGKMKLVVAIVENGIRLKYPPLLRKWKLIGKNEIERLVVRKYNPLMEYGGWGIKRNRQKRSYAYNVKGNVGLQLFLKNGKKILIGTQKKQAIEYAMKKLMEKGG